LNLKQKGLINFIENGLESREELMPKAEERLLFQLKSDREIRK